MGEYESDAAFFSDEYRFTFEWNRKEKGEKKSHCTKIRGGR